MHCSDERMEYLHTIPDWSRNSVRKYGPHISSNKYTNNAAFLKLDKVKYMISSIEESNPFTVETDASVSAKAHATVEALRIWKHYLFRSPISLWTTSQHHPFLIIKMPEKSRTTTFKVVPWAVQLYCLRHRKDIAIPDTLTRTCANANPKELSKLSSLYNYNLTISQLCYLEWLTEFDLLRKKEENHISIHHMFCSKTRFLQ